MGCLPAFYVVTVLQRVADLMQWRAEGMRMITGQQRSVLGELLMDLRHALG